MNKEKILVRSIKDRVKAGKLKPAKADLLLAQAKDEYQTKVQTGLSPDQALKDALSLTCGRPVTKLQRFLTLFPRRFRFSLVVSLLFLILNATGVIITCVLLPQGRLEEVSSINSFILAIAALFGAAIAVYAALTITKRYWYDILLVLTLTVTMFVSFCYIFLNTLPSHYSTIVGMSFRFVYFEITWIGRNSNALHSYTVITLGPAVSLLSTLLFGGLTAGYHRLGLR